MTNNSKQSLIFLVGIVFAAAAILMPVSAFATKNLHVEVATKCDSSCTPSVGGYQVRFKYLSSGDCPGPSNPNLFNSAQHNGFMNGNEMSDPDVDGSDEFTLSNQNINNNNIICFWANGFSDSANNWSWDEISGSYNAGTGSTVELVNPNDILHTEHN